MVIPMKPRGSACIQSVRESLAEATRLLTTPDSNAVERCAPVLARAAALLAGFEAAPYQGIRSDLDALRSDLQRVDALLSQAAQLNMAWARILGSATEGYTPAGAAPVSVPRRVSVEI
jgi:hypothetical protein